MISSILGTLAMVSSLAISCVGLPRQVWLNNKRKSTEGVDTSLVWGMIVAYSCWFLYGITKRDLFIAISQTPGMIFSIIIAVQIWLYPTKGGQ